MPNRLVRRIPVAFLCLSLLVTLPHAGQEAGAPSDPDPSRWAAAAAERLPMLETCRPEGAQEDMLCGTLEVWENRATKQGRRIGLNVVVVPAHTDEPAPDPVTFIGGGPGEGIAGAAGFVPQFAGDVLEHRDLFLVDARGTGKSNGLFCLFGISEENPQPAYDGMFPLDGVEACKEELEERADLTQYTTTAIVDDLEEVRKWLGYGPVNLDGGSYGTVVVQEYLRRYPESVRTATMQGVASVDHRMPLNHALDGQRSLDLLVGLCESDAVCDGAYPKLRTELWEVLDRLADTPGKATLDNPLNPGQEVTLSVGRGMFAETLRSLLYSPRGGSELPFLVHAAHQGDFEPFFLTTLPWRVFVEKEIASGLYLSVTCGEDTSRFTAEEAALHNAGTSVGGFRTDAQMGACSVWPKAEVPASFFRLVESDAPVLIFVGELDPVTPPRYGREAAAHMPNSRFVLVPTGHHSIDGLSNPECVREIQAKFLETASVEGLDSSCIDSMEYPDFVTEEEDMRYVEMLRQRAEAGAEE